MGGKGAWVEIDLAYMAFLGRQARADERSVWAARLAEGWSFVEVVRALAAAPEARASVAAPERTALLRAHQELTMCSPDAAREAAWDAALAQGRSFEDLLAEMARSGPSASARRSGEALLAASDEEAAFRAAVDCVYGVLAGRAARAEELDVWAGGRRDPGAVLAVFQEMRETSEVLEFERVRTERAIELAARWAFGRRPQPSRIEAWSARVRRGEGFAQAVLQLEGEGAEGQGPARTRRLIAEVYQLTVERFPSDSDIAAWSYQLSRGGTPEDFLLGMAEGPEAQSRGRKPLAPSPGQDRLHQGVSVLLDLVLKRLPTPDEVERWTDVRRASESFLDFLDAVASSPEGAAVVRGKKGASIRRLYELCLGRTGTPEEHEVWLGQIDLGMTIEEVLRAIDGSAEAMAVLAARAVAPGLNDAEFAHRLYDVLLERGPAPSEIQHWVERLGAGSVRRDDVLTAFFNERVSGRPSEAERDPSVISIMGTLRTTDLAAWRRRRATPPSEREDPAPKRQRPLRLNRPAPKPQRSLRLNRPEPAVLVSCIASLYRGRQFMPQFLENMVNQTIFKDHCELIIVDANSPEREFEQIGPYLKRFPNIRYHRVNYRIGIYDAWNVGVGLARGAYVTNTNADDLRRPDSLEVQAATLDLFPFADVVYQDFYYTYEWDLTFDEIAAMNVVSSLPIISPTNMLIYNSPHNAPMWRKSLHDAVGLFDIGYKSAGDYEFWLRCLAAGKIFYKINDPHVAYYHNPKGLSTQAETLGIEEARRITRKYSPLLLGGAALTSRAFAERHHIKVAPSEVDAAASKFELLQRALIATAAAAGRTA